MNGELKESESYQMSFWIKIHSLIFSGIEYVIYWELFLPYLKTKNVQSEMTELEIPEFAEVGADTKLNLALGTEVAWS